ncbi:MAG: ABC transporter ATP-binding protein [Ignavibacteriaceae bacterium]
MNNYFLHVKNISKFFGRRLIFKDMTFEINNNGIIGISGDNGSGKSTLVKIIAGITSPSSGEIVHQDRGKEIIPEKLHNYIGFVSPYLVLYEEFSAYENLSFFSNIRGIKLNIERADFLLEKLLLFKRKDDLVKTYSSGMKQRLKFIFALIHNPSLIILDEPTSNLDSSGKDTVYQLVENESKSNIIIIASNEQSDLNLCQREIKLQDFKLS